jgi:phage host-nuclease inhibitor protein Gam
MIDKKSEYIEKISERLKELDREISKLEKAADKAVEAVKAEYRQQITDLFLKKAKVHEQIDKLQEASGNAWEDMKAGTELSWEVFRDSVERMRKNNSNNIPG